jgi:RHS repeat-associated protein
LSYSDANRDNLITHDEILEENNFYPFGLKHTAYNTNERQYINNDQINELILILFPRFTGDGRYNYKYNGKEYQDELGLNFYDYGARNYDPALGRWMNMDALSEMYIQHTPYAYAINNPIYFIDPDGKRIIGVTKDDTEKVHDDLKQIFKNEKFNAFRSLITRSGKKGNGKDFNKIEKDALGKALEGLEGDDLALATIVANTINSEDDHYVEYTSGNEDLISSSGENAFSGNLPSYINIEKEKELFGGIRSFTVVGSIGGGGTVKTKNGTHTIIQEGSTATTRDITSGHELFGHGRSLMLGRESTQHIDAVRTENLIHRVMGNPSQQIDGSQHFTGAKIIDPQKIPEFK